MRVTGVAESWMPLAVGVFGIGAIIGNIAGGWLVDKFHFRAAAVVLLWSIVMLLLLSAGRTCRCDHHDDHHCRHHGAHWRRCCDHLMDVLG